MNPPSSPLPVLAVSAITKRYASDAGTVVANDDVSLSVEDGALHAIVGENGAGKSTLAHVVAGLVRPDTGEVTVEGRRLPPGDPAAARAAGIGLVPQHVSLVEALTVWENVVLGDEPVRGLSTDADRARDEVRAIASDLDLDVDPDALVGPLPLPVRQGVEILKALRRRARILILDEPTSVLGPAESARLFDRIHALRASGTTVLLVTHRMREVLDHATAVSVLRRGRSVAGFVREAFDEERIVEAIIGRPAEGQSSRSSSGIEASAALEVDALRANVDGTPAVDGLSLAIRRGEVLGLAGVAGNGQTELVELLAGTRRAEGGTVRLEGVDVTAWDAKRRRRAGLAYIPEDRRRKGLVGPFSVADNLFLGGHDAHGRPWRLDRPALHRAADNLIAAYDIRTPSALAPAESLSGGNQQKVVIARELSRRPRVILAAHPTQGLDLGAAGFVHDRLREAADAGAGVLVVSNDLEELRGLADRIAVIYKGRIAGIADAADSDEQILGRWMTSGGA